MKPIQEPIEDFKEFWKLVVQINNEYIPRWRRKNFVYLTNAIAGEVGELCNLTKKMAGGGTHALNLGTIQLNRKVAFEIVDILVYLVMFCEIYGFRLVDLLMFARWKLNILMERMEKR